MDKEKSGKAFRCAALGLLFSALAVRLRFLYSSLQYDELWSWQFFSRLDIPEILFSLALPNNHPLNTIAIKAASAVTGDIFAIRYFPLLCGVLLIPLIYFVTKVWSQSRTASAIAAIFAAFSAPLVIYSALARGYMPQAFFFAITAAGFACFTKEYVDKYAKAGFAMILIGGTGTILSVPTGIVFLAGLVLAIICRYRSKPHKLLIYALAAGAVIAGVYYIAAYSQLTAAQKWSTGGNYFIQCGNILFSTGCFALLSLSLTGCLINPRLVLPLMVIPLTVLLSGAVTGLGPERTYIIFTAVFACASGIAVDTIYKFKYKNSSRFLPVTAAVLLFLAPLGMQPVFFRSWQLPEWKLADVKTPSTTLCIYTANSGYPMLWNHGEDFLAEYQKRVGKSYLDTLRVYAGNGIINGMDDAHNEKNIPAPLTGKSGDDAILGVFHEYALEPYNGTAPENSCFLVVSPLSKYKLSPPENALRLNPWFENSPGNGSCSVHFTTTPPAPAMGRNIFVIKSAI